MVLVTMPKQQVHLFELSSLYFYVTRKQHILTADCCKNKTYQLSTKDVRSWVYDFILYIF